MGYTTKFIHDLRVGQTVYLVQAKRVRCSKCGSITKWKYYVKTVTITGLGWHIDNKKRTEIYYYCRKGTDNYWLIGDTIFTSRKDAEKDCTLQQAEEDLRTTKP